MSSRRNEKDVGGEKRGKEDNSRSLRDDKQKADPYGMTNKKQATGVEDRPALVQKTAGVA
jgi:hypothetical protein